ncbi:phospholipase D-like domain-containing protein [Marinobacter bryozoorum]|uniref:phospholipase D-like domain-containing protein n=1 Tax=Marinobacter bryozoorum TaxID=256324 RepID=UPI0020060414|nr:phospholipase D-like domain-containing protein [Marinobacter bryozoorum]MCK7545955.1 phospholipase D-like domain-containing protein [Marinobacter bryozoorum]
MISFRMIAAILLLILLATGLYNTLKPLPAGLSRAAPARVLYDARLIADVTWRTASGERMQSHGIFNELFRLVGQARKLIVVDMFLFNDSAQDDSFEPLADKLATALIQRKQASPELVVIVITDPLNTVYGGLEQPHFKRLRDAGITLVETDLRPLRDSNPAWSAIWRWCCQWFGNTTSGGWLPNALGDGKVTLRSYLSLLNFKANHRKTLVVDEGDRLRGLITSANPHAGSSRHWNTAISFTGPAAHDLLATEEAVMALSGLPVPEWPLPADNGPAQDSELRGQVLTESAIRDAALDVINQAGPGDRLDMAMFYLSHRGTVKALKAAHHRGAELRLLLDRNLDAFGHDKNGIPNRQVAFELRQSGIDVRWCNTSGEQCHNKLLMLRPADGDTRLLLGSANLTRRNMDDYNLETSMLVTGPGQLEVLANATELFERLWRNGPGSTPVLSLPYADNADESQLQYWRYRFMEASGLSTF